jgi:hypothetical protein
MNLALLYEIVDLDAISANKSCLKFKSIPLIANQYKDVAHNTINLCVLNRFSLCKSHKQVLLLALVCDGMREWISPRRTPQRAQRKTDSRKCHLAKGAKQVGSPYYATQLCERVYICTAVPLLCV